MAIVFLLPELQVYTHLVTQSDGLWGHISMNCLTDPVRTK